MKSFRIIVSFIIFLWMVFAANNALKSQASRGDMAAVITMLLGKVYLQQAGAEEWEVAKKGDFLYEGDSLKSDAGSKAAITFVNGIEVKMNENSLFTIDTSKASEKGKGNTVSMTDGQIWSRTMRKGTQFDINTPAATVAIRGSTFDAKSSKSLLKVKCYDGHGYVENKYGKTDLKEGEKSTASLGKPPTPAKQITEKDKEKWQKEVKAKGGIYIEPLDNVSPKSEEAFKLSIEALDDSGELIEDFAEIITLTTNNRLISFSGNQKTWKERVSFKLRGGKGIIYTKASKAGVYLINAETNKDYAPGLLRLNVRADKITETAAEEKTLELNVETKDGKQETLKIKLKK
ncbi:MAG: FecR domain-containing protein [bacterium]